MQIGELVYYYYLRSIFYLSSLCHLHTYWAVAWSGCRYNSRSL